MEGGDGGGGECDNILGRQGIYMDLRADMQVPISVNNNMNLGFTSQVQSEHQFPGNAGLIFSPPPLPDSLSETISVASRNVEGYSSNSNSNDVRINMNSNNSSSSSANDNVMVRSGNLRYVLSDGKNILNPPWAVRLFKKKSEPTPVLKNIFRGDSCSKGPLERLKASVESEPMVIDLDPDEEKVRAGNYINCDLFYREDNIYYVYPETISSIEEWHHADCLRRWSEGFIRFREKGHPNSKFALEHKQRVLIFNSLLDLKMPWENAIEYVNSINMKVL